DGAVGRVDHTRPTSIFRLLDVEVEDRQQPATLWPVAPRRLVNRVRAHLVDILDGRAPLPRKPLRVETAGHHIAPFLSHEPACPGQRYAGSSRRLHSRGCASA